MFFYKWILFLIFPLLFVPSIVFTQDRKIYPEPYHPSEFPPILNDLRRGEIILVGSYPIAILLTTIIYDFGRWTACDGFSADFPMCNSSLNGYNEVNPFQRSLDSDAFSATEEIGIALAAVGIAALIATIDYFLGIENETNIID